MGSIERSTSTKTGSLRSVFGVALIVAGALLFLDRYLKTGWLSLFILPSIGLFLFVWGIRLRQVGLIIAGGVLSGTGFGAMAAWGSSIQLGALLPVGLDQPLAYQLGMLALFSGLGWGMVVLAAVAVTQRTIWWGLIPGGILGGLGVCLLFTPMRWMDFVLYLGLGVGLPLLFWGIITRRLGLMIPGCLLSTIGPGIHMAWSNPGSWLVQIGVMLIWFSLGWMMISAGARIIRNQNIWWPLIPGSILAVVGIGLYIGGDPKHALGFIGNTGSIALMIFGLYLLLMRKGIHH